MSIVLVSVHVRYRIAVVARVCESGRGWYAVDLLCQLGSHDEHLSRGTQHEKSHTLNAEVPSLSTGLSIGIIALTDRKAKESTMRW